MKHIKSILLVVFCLFNFSVFSQLAVPCKSLNLNQQGYVIKKDGTKVCGKVVAGMATMGFLKKVTLKDANGVKHKFNAADLKLFVEKLSKWNKLDIVSSNCGNLKFLQKDLDKVLKKDSVYYVVESCSSRKSKPRLMQILNPGWEKPLQVFANPNAGKTASYGFGGLTLAGGEARGYVVVKNGVTYKVNKHNYFKMARKIYTDCPEFCKAFSPGFKNIKWSEFAMHVFGYNKLMTEKK